jgi:Transglutaminase-like superfamily
LKPLSTLMKSIFITICVLSLQLTTRAQFKSTEELEIGNIAKGLFPDDDVCAINSLIKFSFDINKSDTVVAIKDIEEEMIGLIDNTSYVVSESYNSFSSVDLIRSFNKKGRGYLMNQFLSITDRPYFQSEIFHDDYRYKYFQLDFPTIGSASKYEMRTRYNDIKYLTTVFFHEDYPIQDRMLVFEVPDWLELDLKEFNFEGFNIVKTQEHDDKRKITIIKYSILNCASIKDEAYAPRATFIWPHIVLVPKKFTNKKGISNQIFDSTDDLYKWYSYLVNKSKQDITVLKAKTNSLIEGKENDLDKAKAIFYWVQDNIRYIAFEQGLAGFIPEGCDKVFTSKYGDCKGMANLLTNMLKIAGFDARLTWIGTKDIPYDYSLPSLVVDNHMICTLFLNDETYFLDATEDFIALGDYAHRIQGRPVLIEDGEKYIIKKIPDLPKERNKEESFRSFVMVNQSLVGKGHSIFNGETQTGILQSHSLTESDKKDKFLNRIINGDEKGFLTSNLNTSGINEREKPLRIDYEFSIENKVLEAGGEIYISLDFTNDFEGIMPDKNRQNDYVFGEKIFREYTSEFEIPKGFKVKYIPEPLDINKDDYKMKVNYTKTGNKIVLKKTVSIDNGVIKKSTFEEWKSDLKQLKKENSEQLVLIPN